MQDPHEPALARPQVLADAAVRVIAQDGMRGLTHRAVDREAGLPQGSTSYYASTRVALLELIARRLAERSLADLQALFRTLDTAIPAETQGERVAQVADILGVFVEALLARPDDARARYSLILDFLGSDPLRGALSSQSPLLADAFARAPVMLHRFGIVARAEDVRDLTQLSDALTFSRAVHAASPQLQLDVRAIFAAFLRSLPGSAESA
jgi:AcrR family transcriptional regulator